MTLLRKLIRYRITSEDPFRHGQGAVWRARDLLFDRDVALKEIQADLRHDPAAIESFRVQAAVQARLDNPNIVKVFDYGKVDGTYDNKKVSTLYFAMEWIEGGTLAERCGLVTLDTAKAILRQVGGAVRAAHAVNIVHSDIAPANIFFDRSKDTHKLSDFGYLKTLDESLVSRQHPSMLIGGRDYFLPRDHRDDPRRINKSTDVYALTLTLHHLITGEALQRRPNGSLEVPGVIYIGLTRKPAPDMVRRMLFRFIESRLDTDTVFDFLNWIDKIP